MAYPTLVNGRITDAVTQTGVNVLAQAPAMAMGSIYQSAAHSMSIVFQNTVQAQMQASICAQAATNQGVMQIYGSGAATVSAVAARPAKPDTATQLLTLLVAAKLLNL